MGMCIFIIYPAMCCPPSVSDSHMSRQFIKFQDFIYFSNFAYTFTYNNFSVIKSSYSNAIITSIFHFFQAIN